MPAPTSPPNSRPIHDLAPHLTSPLAPLHPKLNFVQCMGIELMDYKGYKPLLGRLYVNKFTRKSQTMGTVLWYCDTSEGQEKTPAAYPHYTH